MSDPIGTGRQPLHAAEVLLVLAQPEELLAADSRSAIIEALDATDLAHAARFRFAADRDVALASRATQRLALSMATGDEVAPGAWRFGSGDNGRPELQQPPGEWQRLQFSAANTRGLVGCAVGFGRAVGLDLEPRRDDVPGELLDRCLAVTERSELSALPAAEQPQRFVRLWTAKEAYLKARGLGIIDALDAVVIKSTSGERPTLELAAGLHDDAARWRLEWLQPTARHLGALCLERHNGDDRVSVSRRWLTASGGAVSASRCE